MMHNPIFESALKRRMRSFRAPMLITIYVVFLLLVCSSALMTLQRDLVSLGNLRSGLEAYIYLSIMQFALIVLVAPALTSGAISGERERQTLDLLLCTRVSASRIVLGKLLSSACFLALLIVSSLPVMAVTMFFGGVSILDMLVMTLFLLVTALACCAIGIFCSALFKRTATATVVAYLSIFAIGVGTVIFPLIFQRDLLRSIIDIASTSNGAVYASSVAIIGGSGGAQTIHFPFMLLVNPAVGLASLLVQQTGLLRNTFETYFGYRGGQMFTIASQLGASVYISMGILLAATAIMTFLSALFVKPTGLRVKKQK